MTSKLGQLDLLVEPEWVKALYRAGTGYDELRRAAMSALLESSCLRVQLKERGKLLVRL